MLGLYLHDENPSTRLQKILINRYARMRRCYSIKHTLQESGGEKSFKMFFSLKATILPGRI